MVRVVGHSCHNSVRDYEYSFDSESLYLSERVPVCHGLGPQVYRKRGVLSVRINDSPTSRGLINEKLE